MSKAPPLAVPQLGSCTPLGFWRLWAALHTQGKRPAHWVLASRLQSR